MARIDVRVFRDFLYGDVTVNPIQNAVINCQVFQRLRYIRQNGLLHFVFPSAVHTRFSHSIGAMHLAGRCFRQMFPSYPVRRGDGQMSEVEYVGTCFELAALLHDIGHLAFSHSIEGVRGQFGVNRDERTFIPTAEVLLREWERSSASSSAPYIAADPGSPISALRKHWNEIVEEQEQHKSKGVAVEFPANHEALGILLLSHVFQDQRVRDAIDKAAHGFRASDFLRDVTALLLGWFAPSERFGDAAATLLQQPSGSGARRGLGKQLVNMLHNLISGTIDVDRLDYLVRDSRSAGVSYGICDVDLLIGSLTARRIEDQWKICLHERAADALDDMLWCRYQLYVQVMQHKANVMLNSMLQRAIPELHEHIGLRRPLRLPDLLSFTDDYVLSTAIRAATDSSSHSGFHNQTWARALVHRELPQYVGRHDLLEDPFEQLPHDEKLAYIRDKVPGAKNFPNEHLRWEVSATKVVKESGELPVILRKVKGESDLVPIAADQRLILVRVERHMAAPQGDSSTASVPTVNLNVRRLHVFLEPMEA